MSLEAETRAILEAAGAEKIKVAQDALGFVVAATFTGKGFDGQPHSGHTGLDPNTSSDPRDLARRLIEISRREHDRRAGVKPEPQRDAWEEPATTLTEEPTFAPDKDPFGPPPEPPSLGAEILAAEAEAGESLEHGNAQSSWQDDAAVGADDAIAASDLGAIDPADSDDDRSGVDSEWESAPAAPAVDPLDAEFSEPDLPALEGQDVAEEPAETGGGVAYFGDNLHVIRLAKIGRVTELALERMPPWGPEDDRRLGELRNFAAGVGEGRFTNSEPLQNELEALEATRRCINGIESARDAKVGFLVKTTEREVIEAFDPEEGWPQ